jgi:hypothetical protein
MRRRDEHPLSAYKEASSLVYRVDHCTRVSSIDCICCAFYSNESLWLNNDVAGVCILSLVETVYGRIENRERSQPRDSSVILPSMQISGSRDGMSDMILPRQVSM